MIRYALIGCGRIAERGHMQGLVPLQGKEMDAVAVVDKMEERRNLIGDELGVPQEARLADYKEVLARDDIPVVILALPHHLHESITIECAKAGKDIITEKPLTTDYASAKRIAAAVIEAGVKFFIIHNYHFGPPVMAARAAIDAGRIGKPFRLRNEGAHFGHYVARGDDPDWRTKSAKAGGGCVLDMSYHSLYGAEAFMGSPIVSASASLGTYVQNWDVEDTAAMLLNHESGAISTIQISQAVKSGGTYCYEIYGTKGTIRFQHEGLPVAIYENEKEEWQGLEVDEDSGRFLGLFQEAIKAFETGETPALYSLDAALHNLAIVEAIYRAAKEKRTVPISEIEG
jgi:predicted dehydrogenase